MKSPQILSITLVCLMPVLVSSGNAQDGSRANSSSEIVLSRLQADSWATLTPDHGSFRLRLLTNDDKMDAERVIADYRTSRAPSANREGVMKAFLAMPSDIRAGTFYRASSSGSDAIELRGDQFHAILPMRAVCVVLFGPSGSISSRSTSVRSGAPPQDFIDALRSGSRGGRPETTRETLSGRGQRGGLTGRSIESGSHPEHTKASVKPTVFFLKFAKADQLVDVIAEVFANSNAQMAVDARLNAIVVSSESELSEQIGNLITVLDRETADREKTLDGEPTLMVHDVGDADATTVFQVLQTLLAGMPDVRISIDERNNRIIAQGRATDHETIDLTIQKLQPTRQQRSR